MTKKLVKNRSELGSNDCIDKSCKSYFWVWKFVNLFQCNFLYNGSDQNANINSLVLFLMAPMSFQHCFNIVFKQFVPIFRPCPR